MTSCDNLMKLTSFLQLFDKLYKKPVKLTTCLIHSLKPRINLVHEINIILIVKAFRAVYMSRASPENRADLSHENL